jgi:hypothetical protein
VERNAVELANSKARNLSLLQIQGREHEPGGEECQVDPTLDPLPVAMCMIATATSTVEAKEEERSDHHSQQVQAQLKGHESLSSRSHEGGHRMGRVVPVVAVEIGIGGHRLEGPCGRLVVAGGLRSGLFWGCWLGGGIHARH